MKLTRYNLETIGMIQDGKLTPDEIEQILQDQKLRELIESKIKECQENAGGMEFGQALEKILKESKEIG